MGSKNSKEIYRSEVIEKPFEAAFSLVETCSLLVFIIGQSANNSHSTFYLLL